MHRLASPLRAMAPAVLTLLLGACGGGAAPPHDDDRPLDSAENAAPARDVEAGGKGDPAESGGTARKVDSAENGPASPRLDSAENRPASPGLDSAKNGSASPALDPENAAAPARLDSAEKVSAGGTERDGATPATAGASPSEAVRAAPEADAAPAGERIEAAAAAELERAAAAESEVALAAPRFTETYKHPAGVWFLYPGRWRLQGLQEGALALLPDDAATVDGGPAELFIVLGDDAQGAQRPDDREVLQVADQLVRATFPFLRRSGDARRTEVGGRTVAALEWRGERGALDLRAEMQVLLLDRYVVAAFVVTPRERFAVRQRTLTDLVRTFGFEKPESDPRLVGRWRHSKTYISGDFSTITVRDLVLRADGACFEGSRLMAGMEHTDSAGHSTGSSHADSGRAEHVGRWRSEAKQIVLEWDGGGAERWEFYVSGSSMLWKSGGEKKLWERAD